MAEGKSGRGIAITGLVISIVAVIVAALSAAFTATQTQATAEQGQFVAEQMCLAWAEFVIAEEKRGLDAKTIDRLGELLSKVSKQIAVPVDMPRTCGTAVQIHRIRHRTKP
jgi:hypothetical protein